jgi:hypothetical protein
LQFRKNVLTLVVGHLVLTEGRLGGSDFLVHLQGLRVRVVGLRFLSVHVLLPNHFVSSLDIGNRMLARLLLRDLRDAVGVAAVEDAVSWVLSNAISARLLLVLGTELVAAHRAV